MAGAAPASVGSPSSAASCRPPLRGVLARSPDGWVVDHYAMLCKTYARFTLNPCFFPTLKTPHVRAAGAADANNSGEVPAHTTVRSACTQTHRCAHTHRHNRNRAAPPRQEEQESPRKRKRRRKQQKGKLCHPLVTKEQSALFAWMRQASEC